MSFLTSVQLPGGQSPTSSGSFLKSVTVPSNSAKIGADQQQFNQAAQTSAQVNSPMGILKNTVSDLGSKIGSYFQSAAADVPAFGNNLLHPISTLQKIQGAFTTPLIQGESKAGAALYGLVTDPGSANKVADAANILSGVGQAIFSPVSGLNTIAMKTPGLRQVAESINIPFTAAGIAGGYATGKILDAFSNVQVDGKPIISPQSLAIIKQPLQDVGSFASQIVLGGKLAEGMSDAINRGETITSEVAKTIAVQSTDEATKVPISTTASRHAEYAQKQGYEPYTPPEQLPTIQTGSLDTAKDVLPTIQVGESVKVTKMPNGKFTYEPIDQSGQSKVPTQQTGFLGDNSTAEKPTDTSISSDTTPLPPREPGVTKTASDINQNLVKQGFDALPAEQQAKYTPQSYKDIATKVASMLDSNPDEVKEMAKGNVPIPKDINPEILFNAVEAKAMSENDVQTLRDLANSNVSKTSEAGQTLGAHGFNDNPNSAIEGIKEVQNAREEYASKNAGEDVIKAKSKIVETEGKNLDSEIKKTAPTAKTWSDFIEQLKCNY